MFCSVGTCSCLSNFVAIQGYCYLSCFSFSSALLFHSNFSEKNPGESGCQYAGLAAPHFLHSFIPSIKLRAMFGRLARSPV
jgi:hypothetical protein